MKETKETKEMKAIYTLPYTVTKDGVKVLRVTTIYSDKKGYRLALDGKEEIGYVHSEIMEALKCYEEALTPLKKKDIEPINERVSHGFKLDEYVDNCLVRGFNAYIAKLKADKRLKDFEGDNIVFRFKENEIEYKFACQPKYCEHKGSKYIVFKQLDNNAIVALTERDNKLTYIVRGRLKDNAYNGAFKNLQAEKLKALTTTVLNSYFNGKTFEQCIELCKKCKKYDTISIPACLK